MLTQTGTIGVNAAFLQDLKDDNVHLQDLLSAVTDTLAHGLLRQVQPRAVTELLGEVRDQLATHFALEEFFGYFDDAVDVAPHLSAQADVLKTQHEALFEEIRDLADEAEQWTYGESSTISLAYLRERFIRFHDRLEDHERSERELIMEALYDDIGVGD